jgi:beta-1,4-mannosyltransferase
MKIVDMFGAGCPVLARGYRGVDELVKEGINGRVFEDGEGLGALMMEVGSESGEEIVDGLRRGVGDFGCWENEWEESVGDLF